MMSVNVDDWKRLLSRSKSWNRVMTFNPASSQTLSRAMELVLPTDRFRGMGFGQTPALGRRP